MIPWGDDLPLARRPIATYGLAIATVLLLLFLAPQSGFAGLGRVYGFAPAGSDLWRFLSAILLSGTALHMAFGLLFLVSMGRLVEDTVGRPAFVLYYLMGGAFTFGFYFAVYPDSAHPILGAPGAVGAILAAYLVLFPKGNVRFIYWAWYWRGSVFVPAWLCVALWFGVEFLVGYRDFVAGGPYPIAGWAFAGGCAAGALIALPLRLIAARLAPAFVESEDAHVHMPAVVQQQAQAQWRAESSGSGEILQDAAGAWAARINDRLTEGNAGGALRLFERHTGTHSMNAIEPATRYWLTEACLAKGRYWRAATLLESLLAGGCPPPLATRAHALLAALYGEHPYFHESAMPHLEAAQADIPAGTPAADLLLEVARRVEAAREHDLTMSQRDRLCLMRETQESYRIVEAAPLVAQATGRSVKEVMRDLRNNPGILAWKVPRQRALDLAAALGHAGIHVGLVPLMALRGHGKTEPVEHVSVQGPGLEFGLAGETLQVPWGNLALVTGGFLMLTTEQQQRVYEEARDAALQSGDAMGSFDSMVRELRHLTLVDFWLREPRRHLRVREHPLRLPEAQLQAVVSAILRAAPDLPKNSGLNAVASGVVPADCLFDGRDYFTYYGTWQLQLQDWDALPAVSDSLLHNLTAALSSSL